jgi:hypothetical protein
MLFHKKRNNSFHTHTIYHFKHLWQQYTDPLTVRHKTHFAVRQTNVAINLGTCITATLTGGPQMAAAWCCRWSKLFAICCLARTLHAGRLRVRRSIRGKGKMFLSGVTPPHPADNFAGNKAPMSWSWPTTHLNPVPTIRMHGTVPSLYIRPHNVALNYAQSPLYHCGVQKQSTTKTCGIKQGRKLTNRLHRAQPILTN